MWESLPQGEQTANELGNAPSTTQSQEQKQAATKRAPGGMIDAGSIRLTRAIGSARLMIGPALGGRFNRKSVRSIFAGTSTNVGGRTMVCVLNKTLFVINFWTDLGLGLVTLLSSFGVSNMDADASLIAMVFDVSS